MAEARTPALWRSIIPALVIAGGAVLLHGGNLYLVQKQQSWADAMREEISQERAVVYADGRRVEAQLVQFEAVKGQIVELNVQAQALASRVDGLRGQTRDLDQLKQQRDQAVTEREQARTAQGQAEASRGEAEAATRRTLVELERTRSAALTTQGELDKLVRQVATAQDDIRRLQGERTAAEVASRAAGSARQDADNQAETASRAAEKARQDAVAGQRDLETVRVSAAALRLEVTAAEARRTELDRAAQAVQERARQVQASIDDADGQRRRLFDEVKRLREEQASLLASGDAASLREAELRRRAAVMQTAFEEAERNRQAALQERTTILAQIETRKAERASLQELSAERQAITRTITEAQAQLAQLRADATAQRRSQMDTQAELVRTQQAAESSRVARAEQERQRGEIEDQLTRLQVQRDALTRERTAVLASLTQAEARLSELRRQPAAIEPGRIFDPPTEAEPSAAPAR